MNTKLDKKYNVFNNWRIKNKKRRAEYQRKWNAKNLEKHKKYSRKSRMKSKYGITIEEYNVRLWLQNNKCALCNADVKKQRYEMLSVDHCHETGKVRGLLCIRCNSALAQFGDNLEGLKKVIAYLGGV